MGKEPGVNESAPSTTIAPAGAEVFTHGGAEDVIEEELLEEALELEMVVGVIELEAVEVLDAAMLMQEHPLESFEARFEQADAQVGTETVVVARV